jgi:hypothetical protein
VKICFKLLAYSAFPHLNLTLKSVAESFLYRQRYAGSQTYFT